MKHMASIFVLGASFCGLAAGAQMTVGDLYQLCTSPKEGDKSACRFYIWGVFEGAQMAAGTVQDNSGNFQEAKHKSFCASEDLTSLAMEVTVKMKMGEDLVMFPADRDLPRGLLCDGGDGPTIPVRESKITFARLPDLAGSTTLR